MNGNNVFEGMKVVYDKTKRIVVAAVNPTYKGKQLRVNLRGAKMGIDSALERGLIDEEGAKEGYRLLREYGHAVKFNLKDGKNGRS